MNIVLLESLSISDNVLQKYIKILEKNGHNFTYYERNDDVNLQKERVKNADVLMLANMPLKGEVIRACKNLKYINIAFTGVDHVDVKTAREMGIKLSNASGYSNDSVAELTICMMLSLLRNIPQVDARCRAGKTKDGLVGCELKGKTVGIVGTGAIGMTVAKLCHAFGCKIVAYNGFSHKENSDLITYLPLKEMLEVSDIVTLHCPLTEKSKKLINKEALSFMKKSAVLINAARGGVVDTEALADSLNNGKISGAGIDVFETEPPLDINHPLLKTPNTIVTPHIAFATKESMEKRAEIVFENLNQFLAGNHINKV